MQEDIYLRERITLLQGDARFIPLEDESIDIAFMLDIVEHLEPEELDSALREVCRVLRVGGRLIVHTMPNLWYYALGYPLYRAFRRLYGVDLPRDPRDRWSYKEVHVNEQTPLSLGRALRANGFRSRVYLMNTQQYLHEKRLMRWGMRVVAGFPIIKLVFCNDIFAVAEKKPGCDR